MVVGVDYLQTMRADLLHQSLRVIDRIGLKDLTMHRLAKELGCDVETLYACFPSRDGIVDALLHELCNDFLGKLNRLEKTSDPQEDFIQQQLTFYDHHIAWPSADILLNDAYLSKDESRHFSALMEMGEKTPEGLARIGFKQFTTDREIRSAAEIVRTLLIGAVVAANSDQRLESEGVLRHRYERALRALLTGWKAESEG